jgi:hypothetical protein
VNSETASFADEQMFKISKGCPGLHRYQVEMIAKRESTQAQTKYTRQVLEHLKSIKYTGVVEVETLVVLQKRVTDRYGNERVEFRIRFADILFPDLGLIVEIDGRSHDKSDRKIRCDNARDGFYARLGFIPPHRVDNEDALIPCRSARNIKELMRLVFDLKNQIESGKRSKYATARALAKGRSEFYKAYPDLLELYSHLKSDAPRVGAWKQHHLGRQAQFHEGQLIASKRRRPLNKKKKTIGVKGMNPKKRGRPSKVQKEQLVLRVEEMQKQNPERTLDSIALELGYSTRQLRRIRAADLKAKLKAWAWT